MRWRLLAVILTFSVGCTLSDTRAAEPAVPEAAPVEADVAPPSTFVESIPSGTSAESAPSDVIDTKDLKKLIAQQIDVMDVQDLMKKMARAQAVLGLEGQTLLKNRASLRRQQDRANSIVTRIESDPLVTDAQALFQNEAFRQELLTALELPSEEEAMTAIAEILKKNRVDATTLKKLGHAQQWAEYRDLYDAGLVGIENRLRRLEREFGKNHEKADVEYPVGLVELARKYAKEEGGGGDAPPEIPADDLKELLKQLLGSRPAAGNE